MADGGATDDLRVDEDLYPKEFIMKRNSNKVQYKKTPLMVEFGTNVTSVDIQKAVEAGMNVIKFLMANTSMIDRVAIINEIENASKIYCEKFGVTSWPVAICGTLKTCTMKCGVMEGSANVIQIPDSSEVIITSNNKHLEKCNANIIYVDNIVNKDIKVGMEVSIHDGEVVMNVIEKIDEMNFKCKVVKGGAIKSLSNVNFRGMVHTEPYVSAKDLQILDFCLEFEFDMILINYVRHRDTLRIVKRYLRNRNKRPLLMAGVSTEQCLDNLDEIIGESDVIVLNRELLSYELSNNKKYRLALIQKYVAGKCQKAGKPFFISGGILNGAIREREVWDNELVDVANCILDGATGFILKEGTNVDLTIAALNILRGVCREIEPFVFKIPRARRMRDEMVMPVNAAECIILSAVTAAISCHAKLIIVPTVTGITARTLLWMSPPCVVIAISSNPKVTRLLHTYKSVIPLPFVKKHATHQGSISEVHRRIRFACDYARNVNLLTIDDLYVTLEKSHDTSTFCDMIRVCKMHKRKKERVICTDEYYISLGILKKSDKKIKNSDSEMNAESNVLRKLNIAADTE